MNDVERRLAMRRIAARKAQDQANSSAAQHELERIMGQLLRAVVSGRLLQGDIPETGTLSVRIPADLYRRACKAAARVGL
jgi:hypothetical protein